MVNVIEWPKHDSDRWGGRGVDGDVSRGVRRLADVVRLCTTEASPSRMAAFFVVDALEKMEIELDGFFILQKDGWPIALAADGIWRPPSLNPDDECTARGDWWCSKAENPWLQLGHSAVEDADGFPLVARGRSGLLQCLWWWSERIDTVQDLDRGTGARIAVSDQLAAALLAKLAPAAATSVAASGHAADDGIVQPDGGKWPHQDNATWTQAERAAVFKMRHVSKMSGIAIAHVVGVKRQTLDDLVGGKKSPATGTWPARCTWRPSDDLLRECGFTVKGLPLRTVVSASLRAS